MSAWPILSIIILLPLAGVVAILVAKGEADILAERVRRIALATSTVTLVLTLAMLRAFDPVAKGFQFQERLAWMPDIGIYYHVGVDGISVWLVVLAAFLMPIAILASWNAIRSRVREFMIALLLLEALLIGTFSALDFFLFFLFYDGNMVPMFLIIGGWGSERGTRAAYKFFLYTMTGSVFLLIAILVTAFYAGTFEIPELMEAKIPVGLQYWLWLAMFASFAIKMPLWPVHTWLPEVHVHAPTAGSMITAGVMMKLGTYGFLRFLLPILPDASAFFAPLVFAMGVITVVHCSLVAFTQTDLKKMLAYATLAHMGMTPLGVFSWTFQGIEGTIMLLFSQGVISASLFLCAGLLHERTGTYDIDRMGGVIQTMPRYAFALLVVVMGAVALPGTANFVGEILLLIGTFQSSTWTGILAATVIVLGPVYMLNAYHRGMFRAPPRPGTTEQMPVLASVAQAHDLTRREWVMLVPVLVVTIWFGINPPSFTTTTTTAVTALVETPHRGLIGQTGPAVAPTGTMVALSH